MLAWWEDFWGWPGQAPVWILNPVPAPYKYTTFLQARNALAQRLVDPGKVYWTDIELGLYINEALRTWNALTGVWRDDAVATITAATANWFSLNGTGSPRLYTLTDAAIYTLVEYHLLEPPVGAGTWTGTPQFQLSDLTQALQRRQDEITQIVAANVIELFPFPSLSGRRAVLPDNVLDTRRARFIPNIGLGVNPQTLWRGDLASFRYFTPNYLQTPQVPRNYSLSNQLPLTAEVDFPPTVTSALDLLVIKSSLPPSPPTPIPLAIPDDWFWVLKWGVLGDLLSKESEAQDLPRADYCWKRYQEGIALMEGLPWLLAAELNNVPVGIEAVLEKDQFDANWEANPNARNAVVIAGMDYLSISPRPTGGTTVGLSLQVVRNAPVPLLDGDFIQASRDTLDVILDYAVHLASFKLGGADFLNTIPLLDNFRKSSILANQRLKNLGLFDDVLKKEGNRQTEVDPRFSVPAPQ